MKYSGRWAKQSGTSLMEVLVAMSISLVVSASMLALMSNSLANTTRIIQMTKLTDDLRIALLLMSRDLRRTSYSAEAVYCFGNPDCGTDGSVSLPGDVTINDSNDCITFLLDRDHDGDATENEAGGFRRTIANEVGLLQMWIGDSSPY